MLTRFRSLFQFKRDLQKERARRDLDFLLSSAQPTASLEDRLIWLQQVMQWLRSPAAVVDVEVKPTKRSLPLQSVRLRFLLQVLERNPNWKKNVAAVLRSILNETSSVELLSLNGLAREPSFWAEAMNRAFSKILPGTVNWHDLGPVFSRIFNHHDDAEWIETLPSETFRQIVNLILLDEPVPGAVASQLNVSMLDAASILGANISALGLRPDVRSRMSDPSVAKSPFHRLNQRIALITDRLRQSEEGAEVKPHDPLLAPLATGCEIEIAGCRERISDVFNHIEQTGVSVALVFKLESLNEFLKRTEILVRLLVPATNADADSTLARQRFMAELIRESHSATSLRSHIRRNLDLLSQKVVERVGQSGEHYITTTPREYWQMFKAGAGGGVVTVFTTLIKNFVTGMHLPLFFEGLFNWLNYSGCFLFMQSAHFALATKQPSMTASALANKLRGLNNRRLLNEFVDEVVKITRSQFAAALGNIGFAVPGALLFNFALIHFTGKVAVDPAYAKKFIDSLNPITSLTIPYAALTGGLLWLASVTGGWVENWSAYRRLPEAIARNRSLQVFFGAERAKRISKLFAREINGVGANVSIGFYLAFLPIVGRFFGAPLDVRHVTLSSAALAFSVSSIGWQNVDTHSFVMACIGIFIILCLNFGVSFALALFVALRARRIKRAWVFALLRAVWQRFYRRPGQFVLPTRL